MRIFTAGCFDVLHTGHFNLLLFCRQLAGDHGSVMVSIDTDEKIRAEKGKNRPIMDIQDRWNGIFELENNGKRIVDVLFVHDCNETLLNSIKRVKPDYIVVGSDYKGKEVVGSDISEVIYFKRVKGGFSSTKIIEACQRKITVQS